MSDGVKLSNTQPDDTSQMNCSAKSALTSVFGIHKFVHPGLESIGVSNARWFVFKKWGH